MSAERRYAVIIPSKARAFRMARVIPRWAEHDLPIHVIVERDDAPAYREALSELDAPVTLQVLKRAQGGTGFARGSAVKLANAQGLDAFIMSDDDAHVRDSDDVRGLLRPAAAGFAFAVGAWTSQYGNWLGLGNDFGKEPGKLVPMNLSTDRVYALNPKLAAQVANFNARLKVKENIALQLEAIAKLNLFWYASTSAFIVNVGKRYDPGGIAEHVGGGEARVKEVEANDHGVIHARWGSRYISDPEKRMAIFWKRFVPDHWSPEALTYLYNRTVTLESEAVKPPNLNGKVRA